MSDPRSVVIEELCGTGVSGDLPPANPDTVRFLKERRGMDVVVFALHYLDAGDAARRCIIGARRERDGWASFGSACSVGGSPPRDYPWINICGWWNEAVLCAGGEITGTGSEHARRVRLSFSDAIVAEDDTRHGVALFLVEHGVRMPATAELLSGEGTVLRSHSVFEMFDRPGG